MGRRKKSEDVRCQCGAAIRASQKDGIRTVICGSCKAMWQVSRFGGTAKISPFQKA